MLSIPLSNCSVDCCHLLVVPFHPSLDTSKHDAASGDLGRDCQASDGQCGVRCAVSTPIVSDSAAQLTCWIDAGILQAF